MVPIHTSLIDNQWVISGGWAQKLFEIIWRHRKLNCPFTFKHSNVKSDTSITFDGSCAECGDMLDSAETICSRSDLFVNIINYNDNFNHSKRRQAKKI